MPEYDGLSVVSVAVGSIYLILQNVVSTIIGVLGYALMARVISQEEMGVVAGVTLFYSLVQVLVDFGLNSSIAKFVSEDIGRKSDYVKYVFSVLMFRLLASLIIFILMLFFLKFVSQALFRTQEYSGLLSIVALDMVLSSIASLLNGVLLGSGRLKAMAIFNTFSVIVRWAFITIFLYKGYSLLGVFYGWVAGDTILLILLFSSTFKLNVFQKYSIKEYGVLWSMLKFSAPIYAANIVSFVYGWYDKALILAFLPLQQLGVYNIAYTAFSVYVSIASTIGSSLLSYYGIMYGRGEHQAISEAIKRLSRYTMLILFPLSLGLASTSKQVLTIFAGQQYESGWPILATLSIFGLVYGISTALSNILLIYGKTRIILILTLASTISSIILMPLITILNLLGLAIIKGTSILLSFLLSLPFITKIVKIKIDAITALKTLSSSTIMAVMVLATQQILQENLYLPLHVLVGMATYISLIRGFKVLNGEDVELIKGMFGERLSKYLVKIMGIKS